MNTKELFCILNEYAPLNLSKELCEIEEGYDNSGIILDSSRQTDKILFCLDLTSKSVEKAIELGCGIIVTHHPAIYRPIKNLIEDAPLLKCARERIGVISMHLNLDCAKEGIDYYLAKGLGGEVVKILTPLSLEDTGYGRISEVNATAIEILDRYKKEFKTEKVSLYGDYQQKITRIASFCGSGLDESGINFAIVSGAQMVVSADIAHHDLISALEKNLCVLNCTHYSCENYGMKKVAEYFSNKIKEKIYFFDDERFV